ncbi:MULTISPECIES: restriction endonuclease subunit S [Shewanella]|uniref:Restriction endonuclease subunit S n=1 Tax=Shewanella marisflavi TaxID=260364 RepID=A0ABX5WRV3_9GAMM|nr:MULTISPECIES: restriction endonuclease subunit S [Shewanella]QDF76956.1 restriction endonuclease subunit S [Shewanella marisflavi]
MENRATPITELLSFMVDNRGKTVPTAESGFPLIATNCIKNSSIYPTFENVRYVDEKTKDSWFRAHPEPNDIIFVNKGTPGRVCLVPEPVPFCFAQDMIGFRCDPEKIDYQYLFAVLRSDYIQKKIENYHVGLVIPHFKKGDLKQLNIPRLESREAELAVGKLYLALSEKIELNNHINAELEAMAKTLYDYWFVQFDFPDANGNPYKTSGGKMVYNPTLKREIPEGWEATNIGKISKTELGGTPSTSVDEYWQNADIPWLSSAETASFPIITSEQKITRAGIDNSAATLLSKGTVVISIVRYIRPSILGIDAATNQSVVGIRECKRLKSSFLYPYFCREVPRLMGLRTGAQQPHINKGVIEGSPIVIPCEKVLTDYYKVADPIFEKIMNLALQSHELMKLRDWLLPMLMNGQVTVGEAS